MAGNPNDSWETQAEPPKPKISFNVKAAAFVPGQGFRPSAAAPTASEAPAAVAAAAPVVPPVVQPVAQANLPTPPPETKAAAPAKKEEPAAAPAPAPAPVEEEPEEELVPLEEEKGKEHVNIIFMGHVDAGKSTTGGHILYLTGQVDKRTLEKYEREAKEKGRESWFLSWALDTNPEERDKGKTVEVGRGLFETEAKRYTILDAPGHKSFVPNMIGGAAQADYGILVISARKGEFESGFEKGGQTREHAMLAKTAGVRKLVVAINKMDDPTVNWSHERYNEIVEKLKPYIRAVGFSLKTDVEFMPISGFTGANLKDRLTPSVCSWYSGPSLLEYLDNLKRIERPIDKPLRMPIAEKFRDMGTMIAGKVESGFVKIGQRLVVMPNNHKIEISGITVEEEEVEVARVGDNVRLRIKGAEEEEVSAGFVLCHPKARVRTAKVFEAQLVILEHKNIICPGFQAVMHIHTCIEEITISAFLHLIDKETKKKSKVPPKFVKAGQICIARIECEGVICVETYDDYPQLGRFTLRDEGKTIAMGKVVKLVDMSAPAAAAPAASSSTSTA